MSWLKKKRKFDEPQTEPLFMAVPSKGEELQKAYARAAASMAEFRGHIERPGEHICSAKLRFRDPNESERAGKDIFLFLWLTAIEYGNTARSYVGTFFEVPSELGEWHWVGQRLGKVCKTPSDTVAGDALSSMPRAAVAGRDSRPD